jgi:hypothetical protein
MIRIPKAHRFVPCAATVLTLTVAVTLRVEHSCSQDIRPPVQSSPAAFYLHPEILSVRDSAALREKENRGKRSDHGSRLQRQQRRRGLQARTPTLRSQVQSVFSVVTES